MSLRQWWDCGKSKIKEFCQQYTVFVSLVLAKFMRDLEKEIGSLLANAALLAHPSQSAQIALTTDASLTTDALVGAMLGHGVCQPLAFFSHTLRDNKHKYSVFDRELLALHQATRHFHFFLEGRQFTTYVDHKPLTFALSKVSDPWSARQQRHLAAISDFTMDIQPWLTICPAHWFHLFMSAQTILLWLLTSVVNRTSFT